MWVQVGSKMSKKALFIPFLSAPDPVFSKNKVFNTALTH